MPKVSFLTLSSGTDVLFQVFIATNTDNGKLSNLHSKFILKPRKNALRNTAARQKPVFCFPMIQIGGKNVSGSGETLVGNPVIDHNEFLNTMTFGTGFGF